jgi:hypothetical protein
MSSLLKLTYLVQAGASTASLTDLVPTASKRDFFKGLAILRGSVTDELSFRSFLSLAETARPAWTQDPGYLTRLAHAARRGGRVDLGIDYLERALAAVQVRHRMVRTSPDRHLTDPWRVLGDVLDLAGGHRRELFPVAATLLGFVRERGFISHDYDMDFAVRSPAAHQALRESLHEDWRFELARGRAPDVLKVKHINGTGIDIYLFRRIGDRWSTQSHVYGWRFDDFDLVDVQVGSARMRIPSDAEHYLEQMYGPDWRTPQPGFESGLFAPNRFFPDLAEVICAVLNKTVTAAKLGDARRVERYRRFLSEVCDYEMPQIGSTGSSNANDSGGNVNRHSDPGGQQIQLPTGRHSATGISVVEMLTMPHKSRGYRHLSSPSFCARMDERIRRRRYLRKQTKIVPVSQALTNKSQRDRILADLGLPVPRKLLAHGTADEVVDLIRQHDELVVKPAKGSGSRGVMLLRKVPGGWLDLRTEEKRTLSEISAKMSAVRIQDAPVRRWVVETLIAGGANASDFPMDYKFYMFQEECGLIVSKRHLAKGGLFRWYSPDWRDVETGKHQSMLDPDPVLPKDPAAIVALARSVSTQFPLAFVRVDIIDGRQGAMLSELSPLPGQYDKFTVAMDTTLGTLWEIADATHGHEFLTAERFSAALAAIRHHTGAEQIYPD